MERKVHKFGSIEQFRTAIKEVTHKARFRGKEENGEPIYEDCPLPTLSYHGTVKLHGTNAGMVWIWNELTHEYEFQAQSRKHILTPQKDNNGFAAFAHTVDTEAILAQVMKVFNEGYTPEIVKVFGEWCGGNIQKGVGLNKLDKMYVIFDVKIDNIRLDNEKLETIKLPDSKVYNILDYPTYDIEIDFNNPKEAAERMAKLVDEVEKECPVAKAFGSEGIGEGIVWRGVTEGYTESRFWFKTKGEEHQSSGTKEKVPVDIERVNSMNEMVDNFVTESRLLQGIDYLKEEGLGLERKNLGPYLKWVYNDILKEELDTIMGNGFEPKEISGTISNKARAWFFEKENEGLEL